MPATLATPVLQVDANVIHRVDTRNPDNLFSMWTVFARCAESVDQGRRLENLSWRLWTRETFCCEGATGDTVIHTPAPIPAHITPPLGPSKDEVPQLSGSIDSVQEEEADDFGSDSQALEIVRPRIQRQDSCASSRSRGKERHITSDDLEKMVVSIVHAKEPLKSPLPGITVSTPTVPQNLYSSLQLGRSGSTTESTSRTSDALSVDSLESQPSQIDTASSPKRRTTVVLGFSPSKSSPNCVSLQATPSPSTIPEPEAAPAPKPVQPRKQQPMFAVGASSGEDSYSDRGNSVEVPRQPTPQKKIFQAGPSSSENSSLKSALHTSNTDRLNAVKKTASFSNHVETRTYLDSAIVDDDESETDYIDESAIDDDDDSSDWEDSIEDSGKSSVEEKVSFKRDNSKVNLTSHRSLITLMLAQNDRSQKAGNIASQSTSALPRTRVSQQQSPVVASPSDSDEAPLEMKRNRRAPPMRPITEIPRSSAQPIMTRTHSGQYQAALSPRTTRRNMLATELTESLRRHLLWERSQKTSTVNAVLKRRHTSHDVANLKQHPEQPCMKKEEDALNAGSWDQYMSREAYTGYHSQGW